MARKSKIKSCIVLNPPSTPKQQEEYDRRVARTLAESLYRSLNSWEYDTLIRQLKMERVKREKQVS